MSIMQKERVGITAQRSNSLSDIKSSRLGWKTQSSMPQAMGWSSPGKADKKQSRYKK